MNSYDKKIINKNLLIRLDVTLCWVFGTKCTEGPTLGFDCSFDWHGLIIV